MIRKEGYDARQAGTSRHACPAAYAHTMNRLHWCDGWWEAERDINTNEDNA